MNVSQNNINKIRKSIDRLDARILKMLEKRAALARKIGREKKKANLPVYSKSREANIFASIKKIKLKNLSSRDVIHIFKAIVKSCRRVQE